jgi:hypothetical protein
VRSFLLALPLFALLAQATDRPVESPHRAGPAGLEGWTLNWALPDKNQGRAAFTLVIARKGHILRRIEGGPTIWQWIFLSDGKHVALESGPLHFSMSCVLVDIASGKEVGSYDCYNHEGEPDEPAWAKELENSNADN